MGKTNPDAENHPCMNCMHGYTYAMWGDILRIRMYRSGAQKGRTSQWEKGNARSAARIWIRKNDATAGKKGRKKGSAASQAMQNPVNNMRNVICLYYRTRKG